MASRHLSGEELLQHIKSVKHRPELPQRGGFKEYEPDGSWLQTKRLEYFYDERRSVLLEERVQKISSLAIGEWDEKHGKVLVKKSGKFWKNMGHVEDGKQLLFPEEALFLIDEGVMEVYRGGVPLSVEEAYSVLLGSNVPLEHYQAFAHLCRLGYIVQRFEKTLATFERQIGFDENSKSKRKKSKKRKQQTTDAMDLTSKRSKDEPVNLHQCGDVPCDSEAVTSEDRVEEGCWSVDSSEDRVETVDSVTNEVQVKIECAKDSQKEICGEMSNREDLKTSSARLLWDFDSIEFPDISKETGLEIVLKRPPSHLLPPGVEIAKPFYTMTIVRRDLSQKHRSTSNAVVCGSSARNWAEYKKMLAKKSEAEHLASSPAAILWTGEVTPLVRPSHAVSMGAILSRLKVFGHLDPIHAAESVNCENDAHQSQIVYNVYLPDSKFRKSSPGSPSVCLCVNGQEVRSPSFVDLCRSLRECPRGATLMWAVVDNGDVAFYSFNGVDLPRDESFP